MGKYFLSFIIMELWRDCEVKDHDVIVMHYFGARNPGYP